MDIFRHFTISIRFMAVSMSELGENMQNKETISVAG